MIILKILLWVLRIILAVLCLIVIAFAIPVRLEVGYSEKIKLTVKYLFLKFPIDLEKEKPEKPKKKNKTLEKLKDTFKKHGLEGIMEIIRELAGICGGLLGCVFKHIVIVKLDLNIVVAFEDSYKTAVNYCYVCSGVYPGLAVILRTFKYKDYNVNITADFDKKKPEIDVTADVSIVPWFVVIGGIKALIRFLKLKAKGLL